MSGETVPDLQPLVIIAGPTACGKSALAMAVAEEFGGWIINADSMQVYRDLRVLTARPDAADMARVRHRLYGVLEAEDACSAGRWLELARQAVTDAREAGALPIVVGGTGLYLRTLTDGIAAVPPVPDEVVAETQRRMDDIGGEAFREELASYDEGAAVRLPASDRQRLVRAMAVVRATGRTLDDWRRDGEAVAGVAGRHATILMMPPREELYATIERRFDGMIAGGALDEVRELTARDIPPRSPLAKAVGYPELRAYLEGRETREAAVSEAKKASRHLAKRQMTWFRNQIHADFLINTQLSERIIEKTFIFIRQFLLTAPP